MGEMVVSAHCLPVGMPTMCRRSLVEYGATDEVFTHPHHDVTRELINAIPGTVFRARQLGEFVV